MGFSLKNIAGSIVNPTGLGLSSIVGDFSGSKQQDQANRYALAEWNMVNDYNSPKAQVQRLIDAGLNPYLVNLSGNTAGTIGLTGGNELTTAQSAFAGLSNIMGVLQGKANYQNTMAQRDASVAAAGASAAQANYTTAQTTGQNERNKWIEKSAIADLDYKKAQTKLANAQTAKTNAEADIAQGEADIFGKVGGAKGASAGAKGVSTLLRLGRSFFGGK